MRIEPFEMERWQSLHEHGVEINLSDSGVHPISLRELLEEEEHAGLLDQLLIYTQTNGSPELRERIAALYPGADADHVQVTNGGAEANYLGVWSLVEPGDEVVVMVPNYMQVWGLARHFGAHVREWALRPDFEGGRWRLDLSELAELVTPRTKLICVCNPNNPTGARLRADELDEIGRLADAHGSWVLCDEIYQGSELDGQTTSSLWGRCERAFITNSLSKAYGLPGLRLGWIVAPHETTRTTWAHHDYTTIGPGALSDRVATLALGEARRTRILTRTRELLGANWAVVARWLARRPGTLRHIPPEAGAMLYLRYEHDIGSTRLAERLLTEESLLLVPGDHFHMDGWLRIGFGNETEVVERGLDRLHGFLTELEA